MRQLRSLSTIIGLSGPTANQCLLPYSSRRFINKWNIGAVRAGCKHKLNEQKGLQISVNKATENCFRGLIYIVSVTDELPAGILAFCSDFELCKLPSWRITNSTSQNLNKIRTPIIFVTLKPAESILIKYNWHKHWLKSCLRVFADGSERLPMMYRTGEHVRSDHESHRSIVQLNLKFKTL